MKKYSVEEIIQQYEKSGRIIEETTQTGDYKTGNREVKKLTKIFKLLEKDRELAAECIRQLYKSECTSVKTTAAAYSLSLGIDVSRAEAVLYDISQDKTLGILRFNAEMTLKVWKERGWLKTYPEQQVEIQSS